MGIATTFALAAAMLGAEPPASPVPRTPQAMREVAPALARYTDALLFGDVWARPGLSPRDRSVVTVSTLIAGGKAAQLTSHLNLALDNGVKAGELSALITNAAFLTGWPNAVSAVTTAKEVFDRRGIKVVLAATPTAIPAPGQEGSLLARYALAGAALWAEKDLAPRDRALASVAMVVAADDLAALPDMLARGRRAGLTGPQVEEALLHLSFYAGRPKAEAAARIVEAVYGGRGMAVVRRETEPRRGPANTFTGRVEVTTPFNGIGAARVSGAAVTFAPGARTRWHRHPLGQTLAVTKGCGWTQVEGGPVERICAGDIASVAPGAKHWHGATRSEGMSHVAIAEQMDGESVAWLGPVSEDQYTGPGEER